MFWLSTTEYERMLCDKYPKHFNTTHNIEFWSHEVRAALDGHGFDSEEFDIDDIVNAIIDRFNETFADMVCDIANNIYYNEEGHDDEGD